ncbi:hypothetical protein ID866_2986 [Astraeus odoratus]|nr:hypothetical protein ID866_2986 [Astraeus odoratus]
MTPENRYQIVSQSRQDIFRGSSLPHVLSRLENALKRAAKSRRAKKPVLPLDLSSPSPVPAESSRGRGLHWSSTDVIPIRRSKGKQKMVTAAQSTPMPLDALSKAGQAPKAWWLDVANPTWDDMRTIGKHWSFHLLHLDWIAHGLLDSVVDSLFPILKEIQKEVAAIEAIVFSSGELDGSLSATIPTTPLVEDSTCNAEKDVEKIPSLSLIEKVEASTEIGPRFSVPRLTIPLAFRRLKRKITSFLENTLSTSSAYMVPSQSATTITLRRMARTRRLVTSLTRLLASKSEVVSQIRKRYLNASRAIQSDDLEIAMYMGDIQDHILALHQALSHYEHMLSEFHPAYLSQLRTRMSNANKGSGKAVLLLSVVSFAALVPGPIIGAFSMNVHTPRNTINNPVPSGGHYWFGIVLALVAFVECTFLTLVRWWWVQAKRTRRSKLS